MDTSHNLKLTNLQRWVFYVVSLVAVAGSVRGFFH
jgi:hypothetical protein